MTELGQTSDPRDLIPGEPEAISNDLRELIGTLTSVDEIGGSLGQIDPVSWIGEASNAFRSAFGDEVPKWAKAVEWAGDSGELLCDFADVLNWGQSEAQRAIELYHQAQAASRAAAARYDALIQAGIQILAPFWDPGEAAAQEAQAILDAARERVAQAGGAIAMALGFSPDGEGFKRTFGETEWGAEQRTKQRRWDPETGQWVEEDPGGWQHNRHGSSYRNEWGSQADNLLHDKLRDVLGSFGIEIPFAELFGLEEGRTESNSSVSWMDGSLSGEFEHGSISGKGSADASLLGAGAGTYQEVTADGIAAGANAEAYLGKFNLDGELDLGNGVTASGKAEGMVGASAQAQGSVDAFGAQGSAEAFAGARVEASGEMNFGDHASVSASGDAMAGATASAEGSIGLTGVNVGAEAFAGARVTGEVGAEVAGIGAGVSGEAWAGAGVEASAQFGMGDDGKFHLGASLGVGLGVGGKVGFDVSVDPGGVVDAVSDAANAVGEAGKAAGNAIGNAAETVGDWLGF
ncbi:putative T7SS-secreted protein [Saccharomonospora viridis]|jgi:hypothetical protein|uniref:Putative T7SS secretion signal domain-containing protein n=2 Tax=Saccharomonospora viridis TaxID=1852 RepID=C7MW20_SACVD|nr:hypothetical protein [Saccharomonospora viridis]ACU97120.1 hypothetical protein Svir_21070 [Saccharomonospora viridis DSM 43017]KHF43360.1 hypothetical protein MINT15_35620 [Saccharomonospora viridis]SFO80048.1 hypothetical protein SAMN02982918_0228 [Saccharomonospora viridis]